jgi:hypothetical protein
MCATTVAITTLLVAAALTIIGCLPQSFQWGAAWREMVLTAERLDQERDRITSPRGGPESDLRS